jgi:hypothetical protein
LCGDNLGDECFIGQKDLEIGVRRSAHFKRSLEFLNPREPVCLVSAEDFPDAIIRKVAFRYAVKGADAQDRPAMSVQVWLGNGARRVYQLG